VSLDTWLLLLERGGNNLKEKRWDARKRLGERNSEGPPLFLPWGREGPTGGYTEKNFYYFFWEPSI